MAGPATILVADDDRSIRTVLTQALSRLGHEVRTAGTAAQIWRWIDEGIGDLVITDVVMPDESGLDLIPRIQRRRPGLRIIVMSAQNTLLTALKASERGAFEYLPKPFDLNHLVEVVQRALSTPNQTIANNNSREEQLPIVGRSAAMQDLYRALGRVMRTDLTMLITGESGTGKEIVARVLHEYGPRRAGPFVAINMAAIPRDLIESELFGHEKGAFTGALQRKSGRFEQAEGGSLFLDEIGDMPTEAQTRLLRVLQEGEYTTVGGRTPIRANVRIIAATHRDLRQLVRQGLFREDLFYRLNVVPLRLPPLRERTDDIPELVRHFFDQAEQEGLGGKSLDITAFDRLRDYHWPGNIRELENLVRRLAVLYSEDVIGADIIERELGETNGVVENSGNATDVRESLGEAAERHLRAYFAAHSEGSPPAGLYDRVLREIERPLIALTLDATRGNQIRAAELLGVNRNTLRKKIRELDIKVIRSVR